MALAITRRPGQSVLVGQQIRLTVLAIQERRVTVEVARTDGTRRVQRALTGPDARLTLGPVTFTARRLSSANARVTIDCPRHIAITRSELADDPPAAAVA